jgi:thiamine-phosphate pyrophosphorylase
MISSFHVLTIDHPNQTHIQQVNIACDAGANWIQLRCKNLSQEVWLETAYKVKSVCDIYNTSLIINDNISIAKAVDANGVHLGKEDNSISEARAILGNDKIIGFSCNSFSDMVFAKNEGANYVGLGPYRFTTTRNKLNPILGLDGIKQVMRDYLIQEYSLPVIAIGGINKIDVNPLLLNGVNGVAVSSAVFTSENPALTIKEFQSSIRNNKQNVTS